MFEHHIVRTSTIRYVYNNYVESVDENSFVTYNQFFNPCVYVSEHIDVTVADVQFVLVLDVELRLVRILLLDGEHKEA